MKTESNEVRPPPGVVGGLPKWLFRLIVLELVSIVLFIGILWVGEYRRLTLIPMYLPRQPLLLAVVAGGLLARLTKRRVRELIAAHIVLGLVVLFPVMGLSLSTSTTLQKPIRMASYNVWYGHAGREKLVDEIVALPDDIIVIQAAYGSLGETLQKRLPDRTIKQELELVVVSKFPVRSVEPTPPLADGTPSVSIKYVIDTPQGALRVFNVHAYSPRHALGGADDAHGNIGQREGQLRAVVAAARSDVPPFIIAGDTNAPAMSAVRRNSFAGLTDAFDTVGFGFGYTFPAKHPWMRIDRAVASEGVTFGEIHVQPLGASDHRAIEFEIELTSRE